MCAFAPYDIANARAVGYDVVSNRPKVAAYRAPGSPIGAFAVESVLDVLAQKIGMDPLQLRLKNAAKTGTQMLSGAKLGHDGYAETIKALIRPSRLQCAARQEPGTRRRLRLLVQRRRRVERDRSRQRRRHRRGGDRQPRYRRLARLDGDHGGRDAGRRYDQVRADRGRHRVGRLHARDRRLARDVRDRHGAWSTRRKS